MYIYKIFLYFLTIYRVTVLNCRFCNDFLPYNKLLSVFAKIIICFSLNLL